MGKSSTLAGIIGLILLIFGIIDYFIASGFRFFVFVNIIAGVFAIVLWATTSSRESLGLTLGSRTTRYGANALIYSLAFIGILIFVNYLADKHDRRIDTTEEKVFSLSTQSTKVVQNLKKPLKLYGFFQGGQNQKAHDLYEAYAYASPKVSFEMVDPDKHPELAERYKVTLMGTTRVQYDGDGPADGTNVTELSEENLTNAIIKVTKGTRKVVDFVDGEGEGNPDDAKVATGFGSFKQALEGEGYTVRKLFLASKPEIPSDTNLVVVAGPTREVSSHVLDALTAYLKRGGHLLVTLRPQRPDEPDPEAGLIKMLGDWGVKAGNDVIVDQVVRLFAGPALGLNPVVNTYGAHPITNGFTQRTVFPMTRSVQPESPLKAGLSVVELAKTSETSWAETDLAGIFQHQTASYNAQQDHKGPLAVADAVDGNLKTMGLAKDGQAKLVVIGSTDFANNQYFNQFFNRDFAINSVDWLAGEEKAISIRPRTLRSSSFRLTVDQFSLVFALSVLLLPELLLILGVAVWWERRV
jgi:gliding motility-associatede transport system auxiliary component